MSFIEPVEEKFRQSYSSSILASQPNNGRRCDVEAWTNFLGKLSDTKTIVPVFQEGQIG
jgi:hypothetical protein